MELHLFCMSLAALLLTSYIFASKFVRNLNGWYYDLKLRNKKYPLPPGDMGWPLIGNLLPFYKDFSSGHPDSFINNIIFKYGRAGIYKTHLFGHPSIILCESEICRRVLTDDVNFQPSKPKSIKEIIPSRLISDLSSAVHRSLRRQVTAPIIGDNVLAVYLERIENIVIDSLEELSSMKHPVEFLKEMRQITFKVIIHVFINSYNQNMVTIMESLFNDMSSGLLSIPINAPGFIFHKALKARKKLIKIIQPILDEKKTMIKNGQVEKNKKDLVDILLGFKDEKTKLEDDDIIDLFLAFLFAGYETSATIMMWSITYLTQHPHILKRAKEEQEEILRKRSPEHTRLTIKEIKQMSYLSHVIDETLRCVSIAFTIIREATTDVHINDYVVPKGWTVLVWPRAIHMNPEYYSNPEEFNPSRWDDCNEKQPRTFLPFGAGSRLCPGADLAKIEISVFLHYFILNYKLERINSECPITNFPIPKPTDNCLAKVVKITNA